MAGKPRVHELAKELGVESKVVLAKLTEMGEYVKSASSTVEAPVARRLRATFESSAAAAPASAPAAGDGKAAGAVKPAPPRKTAPPKKTTGVEAPSPVTKPTSAHDIEVAAAEVRAAQLKAEQEAAVRAAQERGTGARPTAPKPVPATGERTDTPMAPRPGAARNGRPAAAGWWQQPVRDHPGPFGWRRSSRSTGYAQAQRRLDGRSAAQPRLVGRATPQSLTDADPASWTSG